MAQYEKIEKAGSALIGAVRPAPFVPQITIGVFTLSDAVREVMAAVTADRRLSRASLTCDDGGIDTAIRKYGDHFTPALLLVEVEDNPDALMGKLDALAEVCPQETMVVLLGSRNDVRFYRDLRRGGISEYLVTPVSPLDVIETLGGLFDEEVVERRATVTAFFGTRGGCGSSTLAQNSAWALATTCDTSVLLVDFDLAGGTAALRLDMDVTTTVVTALKEAERLDRSALDRMVMRKNGRFALLGSSADLTDISSYGISEIHHLIDVARGMTSHIVLDLPSGWSRYVEGFLELADQVVLVATPDLVSLRNCGRIVTATRKARTNDPLPHVVLSQTAVPRSQQIKPNHFAKSLGIPIAVEVPFDAALFTAADNEGQLVI